MEPEQTMEVFFVHLETLFHSLNERMRMRHVIEMRKAFRIRGRYCFDIHRQGGRQVFISVNYTLRL